MAADLRKQIRHLDSRLPVPLEPERARHQGTRIALTHDHVAGDLAIERLTGVLGQRRLRVEGVDMADAAGHEERNHGGGARLKCGGFGAYGLNPIGAAAHAALAVSISPASSCS